MEQAVQLEAAQDSKAQLQQLQDTIKKQVCHELPRLRQDTLLLQVLHPSPCPRAPVRTPRRDLKKSHNNQFSPFKKGYCVANISCPIDRAEGALI